MKQTHLPRAQVWSRFARASRGSIRILAITSGSEENVAIRQDHQSPSVDFMGVLSELARLFCC